MLLAHGELARISLPIPLWLTVLVASLSVIATFAMTANRYPRNPSGVALPRADRHFCDSAVTHACLRIVGLLALDVLLIEAWIGPSAVGSNPATTWFYVWFWVGLVPASLLFGDVYRYVNPLRTLALLISGLRRTTSRPDLPNRIGYWPAVAGLLIYLVLDGVSQEGDWPRAVAVFISVYAVIHIAGGAWFGPRWFDRCETFAVYSALIARLAPFRRRPTQPLDRPLVAFVMILMGAAALDGLVHFSFWPGVDLVINPPDGDAVQSIALSTVVLVAASGAMGALYLACTWAIRQFMQSGRSAFTAFTPVLIPVVVSYAISTHLPAALFESQAGYLLVVGGGATRYGFISNTTIAIIQFIAIMSGSVLAALTTQAIATDAIKPRLRRLGQIPLAALLISYTLIGITIVSG
ncbi:hypothetical protein [Smaragdicoccus niigatensis]|uniref:hypothetical protein n=1 Tax=Smaragdicoccus niigatensis TaxID=359359 RepID=UPI0003736E0D|nr:hypothetical protein [Smaragdicoccus niigatensis]